MGTTTRSIRDIEAVVGHTPDRRGFHEDVPVSDSDATRRFDPLSSGVIQLDQILQPGELDKRMAVFEEQVLIERAEAQEYAAEVESLVKEKARLVLEGLERERLVY